MEHHYMWSLCSFTLSPSLHIDTSFCPLCSKSSKQAWNHKLHQKKFLYKKSCSPPPTLHLLDNLFFHPCTCYHNTTDIHIRSHFTETEKECLSVGENEMTPWIFQQKFMIANPSGSIVFSLNSTHQCTQFRVRFLNVHCCLLFYIKSGTSSPFINGECNYFFHSSLTHSFYPPPFFHNNFFLLPPMLLAYSSVAWSRISIKRERWGMKNRKRDCC
jgi:hypothetical protein